MRLCRIILRRFGIAFAAGLALSSGCTDLRMAGSISETTNGAVVGAIIDQKGILAGRTRVVLLPADYDPVKRSAIYSADTTDNRGNYAFSNIAAGDYTIMANSIDARTNALIQGIHVDGRIDTVALDTLKPPGSIKVMLPAGSDAAHGYVYIPGSVVFTFLNNRSDFVTLDSVPAGLVAAVSYASTTEPPVTIIRYGVQVTSLRPTTIWDPAWKYARNLFLNTSETGANVAGTIADFPVLVRLNSENFDFSQARTAGADIRFTKSDNTPLPYEIERWDAAGLRGEIWVKVDTIYGGNDSQSILMYWGNPGAAPISKGAAVFDTAAGFAGVWHLGGNNDSIYDATGNAFNGEKYGSTTAPGMIGNSGSFANGNYIRISGLLGSPSNVTLSAWVRYDTATGGQDVVSIGDAAFIRADDIINRIGTTGGYHHGPVVNDSNYAYVSSGQFLAKTGWHYLAFSINTATHVQTFYIDGVNCAATQDINPIYYAGIGADTYIGKHGNGKTTFNFIGQIDEVRVNNNAVDPDWVKLCFMNQKAQDALIVW